MMGCSSWAGRNSRNVAAGKPAKQAAAGPREA